MKLTHAKRLIVGQMPGHTNVWFFKILSWMAMALMVLTPVGFICFVGYGLLRVGALLGVVPEDHVSPLRTRDYLEVSVADGMFHWHHYYGDEVFVAASIPDVIVEKEESSEDGPFSVVYVLVPQPPLATAPVRDYPELTHRNGRQRILRSEKEQDALQLRDWLRKELGLPRREFSWDLAEEPFESEQLSACEDLTNRPKIVEAS